MAQSDNVVKLVTDKLDRLALEIKKSEDQCAAIMMRVTRDRKQWIDNRIAQAINVYEARKENNANIDFGKWWDAHKLPLNHTERAALIAMGTDPATMRTVLEGTDSWSIELIYNQNKNRFQSALKTPKSSGHSTRSSTLPKAPARDKALEYIMPLVLARKPVNSRKIEAEIGVNHRTVEAAHAIARERVANYDAVRKTLEAEDPKVDRKDLSLTAQQKFDAAIRQERKRIEAENVEWRRNMIAEQLKRIKEQVVPQWEEEAKLARQKEAIYRKLINDHKPPLTMAEYRLLVLAIQSNATDKTRHDAGVVLNLRKFVLTGEE